VSKLTLLALAGAAAALAQAPDWKSLSGAANAVQSTVRNNVMKSAEKMPEEHYGFQPTPEVRTFGQLVGHLADAANNYCAASLGAPNPNPGIEKSKSSKADLVAALTAALEFCDGAYKVNDAQALEIVKYRNQERSRLSLLVYNSFHLNLHYGNAVTYMRLKGITPPSSER
jgi:uncharacterized damage-inducible protein DinB